LIFPIKANKEILAHNSLLSLSYEYKANSHIMGGVVPLQSGGCITPSSMTLSILYRVLAWYGYTTWSTMDMLGKLQGRSAITTLRVSWKFMYISQA